MSFLQLENRRVLVLGLGNRRSVGWAIGQTLEGEGARVIYGVRNATRREELAGLLDGRPCVTFDAEDPAAAGTLAEQVAAEAPLDGLVHSIAFARFRPGHELFHETPREDFLQAMTVSAFSLVEIVRALRPHLSHNASVVAMGISSRVLAPTYGYLSPVKAALEQCTRFLAKSLSRDSAIRCNCVNAGPLKTKSSAGIPGYLENYLYAEKLTLRKSALTTQEVANAAVFLLSPRSSGLNAQSITVNAGMDDNYFDEEVVRLATRPTVDGPRA